ncbi:DUF7146 domain-containing protein [Celeribacter neptunius]|uniref:Toprim domain-containing protein n=1 Tax=Celeribacter neptunius TaxID=588602 RepID=A0A1I3U0E7_9RHOB|nr:toprim domain-containing protein [Celeribacter neptunius]SFJ75251.1 Toprim domain-containing protein [Celeribacter neptunius]
MSADAKTLTVALNGVWHGSYGLCRCPAHGDRNPSLSLKNGNDGRLLAHCHTGCSFTDILDALRGMGLIEGNGTVPRMDPAEIARREAEAKAQAEKKARQASALWKEAVPICGTLAETYLRGRGITCDLPDTLRFHPEAWHPTAKRFPAMLARVHGGQGFAVHRTYLATTKGGSKKASVTPDKAMLGAVKGGAVRLTEAQGPLVAAEGIETALSLACGLLRTPATIWAALSASGIRGLSLPAKPHRLTIATDSDDNGAGKAAGLALAERATSLGWTVSLLPAPDGRDWNDILCMKGAEA